MTAPLTERSTSGMSEYQFTARQAVRAMRSSVVGRCGMAHLKVTYDEAANAAYIYLKPGAEGARVARMYACDPIEVDGMINLDFDASGRLVGVEVLAARTKLSPELLAMAEDITESMQTEE